MNRSNLLTAVILLFCVPVLTSANASDDENNAKDNPVASGEPQEKITLDVFGAESNECAKVLTNTLTEHGVHTTVKASKGKPYRVQASIEKSTDLGEAGKAVAAAEMPGKAKVKPGLDLVMFAKLDQKSAKKATDALGKVKGIDAKHTQAFATKGEINIRIMGGAKLTADEISRTLKDAGIAARFTKTAKTAARSS